jgi:hypothetical protein
MNGPSSVDSASYANFPERTGLGTVSPAPIPSISLSPPGSGALSRRLDGSVVLEDFDQFEVRPFAIDAIQQAKSGHPGTPNWRYRFGGHVEKQVTA